MAASGSKALPSLGEDLGRGDEFPYPFEVLAGPIRLIGSGLRIDAGRSNSRDRLGDVFRAESAGEDDRNADALDDAPAQVPIVDTPESAELAGTRVVTVEEQKVG
jgi:hypothetical protein